MTAMYSLFITSYSLHCNLRGPEGREGAAGQVRREQGPCVTSATDPQQSVKAAEGKRRKNPKVLSSGLLEVSLSCVLGSAWHQDETGIYSQKHNRPHNTSSTIFLLSSPLF